MRLTRSAHYALAGIVCAGLSTAAFAEDLLSVWQAAQSRDPSYLAMRAEQAALSKRRDQARSLWNPNVMLDFFGGAKGMDSATKGAQFSAPGFGTGPIEGASFNTNITLGVSARAAVTAMQPLFDKERQAQAAQLGLAADIGDTAMVLARQHLARSVVERYLDVVHASEMVRLIAEHERLIARADQELRRRRTLGDLSGIDVQESTERLESLRASRLALDNELQIAMMALRDLSGSTSPINPALLQQPVQSITPEALPALLEQMRTQHPQLKMLDFQRQIALREIEKFGAGQNSAKVNAIAQAGIDQTTGQGDFGSSTLRNSHQLIGIQVSIPLSTGGMRSAKLEEATLQIDKIRAERDRVALDLERELRAAWYSMTASAAKISTLERVLSVSRSRVAETRKAHATGARSTLELMASEAAAVEAERNLFLERLSVARNLARLAASAGLNPETPLQQINDYLYR